MNDGQAAPAYVRVAWANALLGATSLLFVPVAIFVAVDAAQSINSQALRDAVIAVSILVVGGLAALFVVRTARLGVYARPEGLQIRGIVRTRMYAWAAVIGATMQRRTDGRGVEYYLPTLVVRLPERIDRRALVVLPPDQRPNQVWLIGLIWLSAVTETTAQRRAREVQSMIVSRLPAA